MWLEALKALEENDDIFGKLRSTYDSLPMDGDRAMFRDIACMMIGMEKEVALTIWKSCSRCYGAHCSSSRTPVSALRRLVDRSLVKVDKEGILSMHDVLRDMGRDIVKKGGRRPAEWTHLWDAGTATSVLSYGETNTSIRGIRLAVKDSTSNYYCRERDRINNGGISWEASQLTSMKELHLLVLDGCEVEVPDDFSSWPQKLRWLRWRWFGFGKLPSQLQLPYLVVLDLRNSYKLTRLWEYDAHVKLPLLQRLILRGCEGLKELAENVGQILPKLQQLDMGGCESLTRLPESIGHLTDLKHLDLSDCTELVSLPNGIVGLVSLSTLKLKFCDELQQLPEELGKLTNLETLDVARCNSLSELPASIGGLKRLKTLDMFATSVKDLPAEFGLLTSLTSFKMYKLCSFPDTFQGFRGLQGLTSLTVHKASTDMGGLEALTAMKDLDLSEHETITTLPRSLMNLKGLVQLCMHGCRKLSKIEVLPKGLKHLYLSDCPEPTKIPSLGALRSLVHLGLWSCKSLRHIHGLECLAMLEYVDVSGCTSIDGRGIRVTENKALRSCNVSGCKVGVAYNGRWLEREPAEQVISCLGDAIPILTNGMANQVVVRDGSKGTLVLKGNISSKAECMAIIWCLVVKKWTYGGTLQLKVEVMRGGSLVMESCLSSWVRGHDDNQVIMCTLRREHLIVQSLQHGDQICVYVLSMYRRECIVLKGGECVVYKEDENLVLEMNSELLSRSKSKDLTMQFNQLILEDKEEQVD